MGTQKESASREWKDRCKRGTRTSGKSGVQWEDVMRTEEEVGKLMDWLSRKAAIVTAVPVPETDTGGRGEDPKADGRSIVKELGKMTL